MSIQLDGQPESLLRSLNLNPIINASGPVTRLGGGRMDADVAAAMSAAAQAHLPIDELQRWAGSRIAALTGAESGYVTSGASAGFVLGIAACRVGLDVAAMATVPSAECGPEELVVQHQHANSYMHLARLAGARLVVVGSAGYPGGGGTLAWQLRTAISAHTCAVAVAAGEYPGAVRLEDVCDIAHEAGVQVVMDAAPALPPIEDLQKYVRTGVDIVAFSGGKAIGGPQGSGIVCGRRDLIDSIALQHQDMDLHRATWLHRELVESGRVVGVPVHGMGRPMKVGKETIVGAIVALEKFASIDERQYLVDQGARLDRIMDLLGDVSDLDVEVRLVRDVNRYGIRVPRLVVEFPSPGATDRAVQVCNALKDGDPGVYVGESEIDDGRLAISASTLEDVEVPVVSGALRRCLELSVSKGRGENGMTTSAVV